MTRSLWPEEVFRETEVTPLSILKEQAAALSEATKGLLDAQVETEVRGRDQTYFSHRFILTSPVLRGFKYELFSVGHEFPVWPVKEIFVPNHDDLTAVDIANQPEFEDALRRVLQSDYVRDVVRTLLAQAR